MEYVPYREDGYPLIEDVLRVGATITIEKCNGGKRGITVKPWDKNKNKITTIQPYLSNVLAAFEDSLAGHSIPDDCSAPAYPHTDDVFDMCIFKGRRFNLYYAVESNTFVCLSTVTEDIVEQTKYATDCVYGTGDTILQAMTNCFVSPKYHLKRVVKKELK